MSNQAPLSIRLADGRSFELPKPMNAGELCLPGNIYDVADANIVGFYDQESETGAIWYPVVRMWMLQQPLTRPAFEHLLQQQLQTFVTATAAAREVANG